MKKIAMVTGAAGMIGSHLVDYLLSKGYKVFALDVGSIEASPNLAQAANNQNFHYTKGDVRNPETIKKFFVSDAAVIFHLAAVVGVRHYMDNPYSLIDINILGTRNILDLCEKFDVRILFTSTSEVYGRNPNVPWSEDDDRVLGSTSVDRWSYSSSKAVVEHMLFGLHRAGRLKMSIIRFFNVYGPRQNPIYVVSQSIHRVLRGESPEIYDGGRQTRCFTYIDDVIKGVFLAGTSVNAIGEVFNIGNPVEIEIREVVDLCCSLCPGDVSPVDIETKELYGKVYEDIPRRVPNVSKAKTLLGWEPQTNVQDGIRYTIAWAQQNPDYLAK